MTKVLVAGSYPPIPVPAAQATLDAVRRSLCAGDAVQVCSPRPSAAHYAVPLTGPFAGRRLNRLRRFSGAEAIVFCVEPGVPFTPPTERTALSGLSDLAAACSLASALKRFSTAALVITGDTIAPAPALRILERSATKVTQDPRPGVAPNGVTARGPTELRVRDRIRRQARSAMRRAGAGKVREIVVGRRRR